MTYIAPKSQKNQNLSPAVKIHRRHLCIRSRSTSQKDYRLVFFFFTQRRKQCVSLCLKKVPTFELTVTLSNLN